MRDRFATRLGVVVLVLTALSSQAFAQEQIQWTTESALSGEVIDGELFVETTEAGTYPLLALDQPGVAPPRFALEFEVRHESVVGVAFFEMWTILSGGDRYFTRTLADSGPMGVITGSSDDRNVILPFELGEGGPVPVRLEINLVAEGPGQFWIQPITVRSEPGTVSTTTTLAEPTSTTVISVTTSTLAVTGDSSPNTQHEDPDGLPWIIGGALLLSGGLGLLVRRRVAKRRAEEERRMNAIDTI